jgi:NDP-sugar pyrophosphorylase family protein
VSGELPPVCLLAGGLGTRLGERVRDVPKPLIEINGEPFLFHQLRLLASNGAAVVVLCVGYRGEQIEQAVGAERFGIEIRYSYDGDEPLGTLGAVRQALPQLGERFLVLYGDTYLRIDYRAAASAWENSGLEAMMTVLRNEGRWDSSNVIFDGVRVTVYDKHARSPEMAWIDYGLGGLTREALGLASPGAGDLAELQKLLASSGQLFGYEASERFYEIGTPASLAETSQFLKTL